MSLWGKQICDITDRPVERGERGESFPGPRDVWGAPPSLKILKMVFQITSFWPKIYIKSIFGTPLGELTTLPRTPPSQMVRGHPSPRFLPFGVSILRYTEWACDRARDNVSLAPLWLSTGLIIEYKYYHVPAAWCTDWLQCICLMNIPVGSDSTVQLCYNFVPSPLWDGNKPHLLSRGMGVEDDT